MTLASVPKTILVTGATGFIGSSLCERLRNDGYVVRRALRHPDQHDDVVVGELTTDTDWAQALDGVSCVIHLAALVHVDTQIQPVPLSEYRRVNVEATMHLARQAANAGVKRFIYLSSIKVNGESTKPGHPFDADSAAHPIGPYAISKWQAEQALFNLSAMNNIEVVSIRPPLVYGPGVKANFHTMMRWLYKGVPLPFAKIDNKRSFVGVDNLIDLIITCVWHPAAANQTYLVSDDHDLSTVELLHSTARALNVHARLFPFPSGLLKLMASLSGKQEMFYRLAGSLQVDITKTRKLLDWSPPCSLDEELSKTAEAFLRGLSK